VVARSAHRGQTPHILTWAPSQVNSLSALNQCLRNLWQAGYRPEQVAVISYRGVKSSEALKQAELGGHATRRFSHYDSAGNAIWTPGSLLVDSVYRFKGQSMPVVVLCEIDFEALTQREKNKLLVGLTRGQIRVDMVMSERSAQLLMP
jgi:superfamily I DNA and RNA helicase